MKHYRIILSIAVWTLVGLSACVQSYTPPATQASNSFLVVDGFLNSGSDSTVITLSQAQNLSSSNSFVPELNAQVSVLSGNSSSIPLTELGNGVYSSSGLNLNYNQQYQLKITTTNGKEYLSDLVTPKLTPPIDSVYWQQDISGVNFYLDTHDPQNNTRYYLWNFTETWQHNVFFTSYLQWVNGQLADRDAANQIYTCWASMNSKDILTASTANLEQDIVSKQFIRLIPANSPPMDIMYSILVRQHAITEQSFQYWQNLSTSTEQLGTLFGPQPSQVTGNIHCVSNPTEIVLGYVSACSQTEERIFINRYQLGFWFILPSSCFLTTLDQSQLAQAYQDSSFVVPINSTIGGYNFSTSECADCTYDGGGTTTKPSFWP